MENKSRKNVGDVLHLVVSALTKAKVMNDMYNFDRFSNMLKALHLTPAEIHDCMAYLEPA